MPYRRKKLTFAILSPDEFLSYLVPDWIDDSDVTLHCSGKNSVSRRHLNTPEHDSCEPDAAEELVPDAAA